MALIKCPECGRENVSDSAEMCPDCGYRIKAHFEIIQGEENRKKENTKRNSSFRVICFIVLFISVIIFYVIFQEGQCKNRNCDERAVKNGKYCAKHTCTVEGCYNYKDGWSNVCETHHQENLERLEEEENTVEEIRKELIEKYGEDVFSDEMHMPQCKYSGCEEEGAGTYGGKWYCSKHLYEMQGYGEIISN